MALPDDVLANADLSSMRWLIANAAPVPYALKQEVIAQLGDGFLFEVYGSTEMGIITVLPPEDQLRRPGSCGKPLRRHRVPGRQRRRRGAARRASRASCMSAPRTTLAGYHRREQLADGWKSVGDIAYPDDEGYLYICDRKKDMVISGGMNIYPAEIEAVLHEHPEVLDVAVFGIPDDEWGESVHAVVVPRDGHALDIATLEAHVAERLADYKRPRSWQVRAALPRTESGKLLKRLLRAEHGVLG